MSNILPKDSSKVSYTQKLTVSKQFVNFAKRTLRVTETGPSRIVIGCVSLAPELLGILAFLWNKLHISVVGIGI